MRISDWSSDVCSSDLRAFQFRCQSQGSKKILLGSGGLVARKLKTRAAREALRNIDGECQTLQIFREQDLQPCLNSCRQILQGDTSKLLGQHIQEIERASCRAQVLQSV